MMTKDELRSEAYALRQTLTPLDVQDRSQAVVDQFKRMPLDPQEGIAAVYLAMPGELDPFAVTEYLRKTGFDIAVPAYDDKQGIYRMVRMDAGAVLKKSHFGVFEPADIQPVDHHDIDIVLIPGLAFDAEGNRLGHGKGHYDQLLQSGFREDVVLIGLGFDHQVIDTVPTEEHDVPLCLVVTEKQIIRAQP